MPTREIYHRTPEDVNYDSTKVEESDELSALIQQIKMIIFTRKGEVLGSTDYGTSLIDYLFASGVSASQVEEELQKQIFTYCPMAHKYGVSVEIYELKSKGLNNTFLVDISIRNEKVFGTVVSL
jgi:phage baseplate assembly protein W